MRTLRRASPSGSLKPKSAAANVWLPSSRIVMVLSAPEGASLTESTWTSTVAPTVVHLAVGGAAVVPSSHSL